MPMFRKKPIITEAIQWRHNTIAAINEIAKFIGYEPRHNDANLESEMRLILSNTGQEVSLGDWIVRNIKGEFYRLTPETFNAVYEEIICCKQCTDIDNNTHP